MRISSYCGSFYLYEVMISITAVGIISDLITVSLLPLLDRSEFVKTAIKIFPQAPLNRDSWKIWTNQVSEKTGRKGKSLFLPLRKALTGKSIGPDMGKLLPLLKKIPEI